MNDRLEDLLRDPRAHSDAPDAEAVRAWGEQALARWRSGRAAAQGEAATPARRWNWQSVATGVGLVSAAAALAPVAGGLLGRAWLALEAGGSALQAIDWTRALADAPPLLFAAGALLVLLCMPQLRDWISRLLDA